MRHTHEERERLINEYAERVGTTKEKASEMLTYGEVVEKYGSSGQSYLVDSPGSLNEFGNRVKTRRKNSHLTQKKKKRKK